MALGPMALAYEALGDSLADGLVAAGFLSGVEQLQRDPESGFEPDGEETEVQTAAALFGLQTTPVRQLMGGTGTRWVVERQVRLELCAIGPVADGEETHEERVAGLLVIAANLPASDPTLSGLCERLELTGLEDDDLGPNGIKKAITFIIRLRSGDPLGLTAA